LALREGKVTVILLGSIKSVCAPWEVGRIVKAQGMREREEKIIFREAPWYN